MEPVAQLSTEQSLLSEDGLGAASNDAVDGLSTGKSSSSDKEEVTSVASDDTGTAVVEDGMLSHDGARGVHEGMAVPDDACLRAAELYGTPLYLYSASILGARASEALAFPAPFGLTVRFAMKACPNAAIVQLLVARGLHIDASSCFEAARAIAAMVPPDHICICAQELHPSFEELVGYGVLIDACSLHQLKQIGEAFPGMAIGVRLNPGVGSGGVGRTNVGGPDASFGIWHEQVDDVKRLAEKYKLKICRIHTHIGSGSDPDVWMRVSKMSIEMCRHFPDVTVLNLGGGYKIARMPGEKATSLQAIGAPVRRNLVAFAEETGRQLWLEIEPGTFLVANAGVIVASVNDVVSTGKSGRQFIKLDSGMSDMLRPQMYGSQHSMRLIKRTESTSSVAGNDDDHKQHRYVVVGHCCESGDIFTPKENEPDIVADRLFDSAASPGDLLVVEHAGAYCASMCAKGYNSYPESPEVLLDSSGELHLIRARQPAEQLWENELPLPDGIV